MAGSAGLGSGAAVPPLGAGKGAEARPGRPGAAPAKGQRAEWGSGVHREESAAGTAAWGRQGPAGTGPGGGEHLSGGACHRIGWQLSAGISNPPAQADLTL